MFKTATCSSLHNSTILSPLSFFSFSPDYPTLLPLVLLYTLPFKLPVILNSFSDLISLLISSYVVIQVTIFSVLVSSFGPYTTTVTNYKLCIFMIIFRIHSFISSTVIFFFHLLFIAMSLPLFVLLSFTTPFRM